MRYQKYNERINAWVEFTKVGNRNMITNVKQKNPRKPFKDIKKR